MLVVSLSEVGLLNSGHTGVFGLVILRVVYYSGQSWMLRMRGSKFHNEGKRYVH